jgi:hypothetical protein
MPGTAFAADLGVHMKKIIILACLLFPSIAFAQYYSAPPPNSQHPGGFHNRSRGVIFGGSIGLGGMEDNGGDIECFNCDSIAGQIAFHLGGFISPRMALMGELQGNFQTLSSDQFTGETAVLTQGALMLAAQYWITPQLWIKGGIGFSSLQVDYSYYGDGIIDESSAPENGVALMGAVGFELLSARRFSVDLQARLLNGSYDQGSYNLTAGSIGIGLNWF